MINESSMKKIQNENDDKSKKYDSLLKACNEKGFFPFSIDYPSIVFSTKISSPSRKLNNKQKFEFSSLKKDFSINNKSYDAFSGNKLPDFIYGYPPGQSLDFSIQKDYFEYKNTIKKENDLSAEKKIKHKLENIFENIVLPKKETEEKFKKEFNINESKDYPIILTINDTFFDLLANIYLNEGEALEQNESIQAEDQNQNKISININIKDDNNEEMNEQMSCICLKSKCLNNYCRCHKNNKICNSNCRCKGCKNNNNYFNSNSAKKICKCKISNCSGNCSSYNCKNCNISKKKVK